VASAIKSRLPAFELLSMGLEGIMDTSQGTAFLKGDPESSTSILGLLATV